MLLYHQKNISGCGGIPRGDQRNSKQAKPERGGRGAGGCLPVAIIIAYPPQNGCFFNEVVVLEFGAVIYRWARLWRKGLHIGVEGLYRQENISDCGGIPWGFAGSYYHSLPSPKRLFFQRWRPSTFFLFFVFIIFILAVVLKFWAAIYRWARLWRKGVHIGVEGLFRSM